MPAGQGRTPRAFAKCKSFCYAKEGMVKKTHEIIMGKKEKSILPACDMSLQKIAGIKLDLCYD